MSEAVRLRLSVSASTMIATPGGAVALVADLGVVLARCPAGRLLDRAIHRVLRHVGLPRRDHRRPQPRVRCRVRQALARGYRDLADQLGELPAAARILRTLPVHDVLELGMSGHCSRVCVQRQFTTGRAYTLRASGGERDRRTRLARHIPTLDLQRQERRRHRAVAGQPRLVHAQPRHPGRDLLSARRSGLHARLRPDRHRRRWLLRRGEARLHIRDRRAGGRRAGLPAGQHPHRRPVPHHQGCADRPARRRGGPAHPARGARAARRCACSPCSRRIWSMAGRTTPAGSATTRATACCSPRATARASRSAARCRSWRARSASSVPPTAGRCCSRAAG